MERCAHLMAPYPDRLKGHWLEQFPDQTLLNIEIGCGKGRFTADTAEAHPNTLFIAVEKVPEAMIIAMERVKNREIANVRFIENDAENLADMFAPGEAARIYINFCDPWPKSRDAKHRLTAPYFLRIYAGILPEGGEIHLKTDNLPLFNWSFERFKEEGWELREITNDLHAGGEKITMTDYEAKFCALGVKINRLVAVRRSDTRDLSSGIPAKPRNASLSDARGNG